MAQFRLRRAFPLLTLALALASSALSNSSTLAAPAIAAAPTVHPGFPVSLNGAPVRFGSVALGDVNGDGVSD
nr:hypothetical protein [Kouleothrix sp.]